MLNFSLLRAIPANVWPRLNKRLSVGGAFDYSEGASNDCTQLATNVAQSISASDQCADGPGAAKFHLRNVIASGSIVRATSINTQNVSMHARNKAWVWICYPIQATAY